MEQGTFFVVCEGCEHGHVGENRVNSLQTGIRCIERNKLSLPGSKRRRETSLASLRASRSVPAFLRPVLPACALYSTKRWLGHLKGQGKDVGEEGKAGRDPLPLQVWWRTVANREPHQLVWEACIRHGGGGGHQGW